MPERQAPRDDSGLVDLAALREYLPQNPYSAPLTRTDGWNLHHYYHSEATYKQSHTLALESNRDEGLVQFRASRYNRINLRLRSEERYHKDHSMDVLPLPPATTVEQSLRAFDLFDRLGATALGYNLARNSDRRYLHDPLLLDSPSIVHVPRQEREIYFANQRQEILEEIQEIQILPEKFITSVLKRLSLSLRDTHLRELANRRLKAEGDPYFYPLKMPSHITLQSLGNSMLANTFRFEPIAA